MTAIMGPSGAGKSTLMNILTGFVKQGVTGKVDFGSVQQKSRRLCCYIRQDDYFYSWLTVEEAMLMASTLKISHKSMNLKERELIIENILDSLSLTKTRLTKCCQLSGGQKKRLSIALELIDNPPILFLDEPTTGLDSSTCYDTCMLLNQIAKEGRTIVCTIHQPSSTIFEMFNHIYVVKNGYCVYQGTPKNTVPFMREVGMICPEYHNPADYLLEVVNDEYGDYTEQMTENARCSIWRTNKIEPSTAQLIKMHETRSFTTNIKLGDINQAHYYPPPEWKRLWILIGRCHMQIFRDWSVTYLKFAMHIFCALTIGVIFGDSGSNATKVISNVGLFLVAVVYLWYTTIMPGVLRFPLEIEIIKKETFNRWYSIRTFYLATLITSTPVHILFSTTYALIIYFMTDQPFEVERFMKTVLVLIATTLAADGFGIILGGILNPINGTFIGAIISCYKLLFAGFLIIYEHMSSVMFAVSYTSTLRYSLESIVLALYGNNRPDTICPEETIYCHMKNPNFLLKNLGMSNGSYTVNIIMLMLQIILFKTVGYFVLKRKLHSA
ncbi:hypothetical protein ACFFRR_003454 [Megaselia abdita]